MSSKNLKAAGLKVTLPRLKILEILKHCQCDDCCHMSAEAIHEQLLKSGEEVGLATVYRVLTQFEQAGLVIRHYFDSGQSLFELNEHDNHDHMICSECSKIIEFLDHDIIEQLERVAAQHLFQLKEQRIVLYGICQQCRVRDVPLTVKS